jgi:hypothetical protein
VRVDLDPERMEPPGLARRKEVPELTAFVRRSAAVIPMALIGAAMLIALSAAPASASTTYTVERTIHLAAVPLVNLCNTDLVNLQGDQHIVVRTTTRDDGTVIVNSVFNLKNARGQRYWPQPPIPYRGSDLEQDYSYLAPPPYPQTFQIVHWTKLIPQSPAPTMYLVSVWRETINPNAPATVTPEPRIYLVCKEPCDHRNFDDGGR